jgi:hypothetical protein
LSVSLVCFFSPSIPVIVGLIFSWCHRYFACSSYIFLTFFHDLFTVWSNSSTLSSILDTLFSTCSILYTSFSIAIFI